MTGLFKINTQIESPPITNFPVGHYSFGGAWGVAATISHDIPNMGSPDPRLFLEYSIPQIAPSLLLCSFPLNSSVFSAFVDKDGSFPVP